MNHVLEWVETMLFPNRCCLCGKVITMGGHMCLNCTNDAPYVLPPICGCCGRGASVCTCKNRRRTFERCVMPFYYDKQVHTAIGILKNQGYISTVKGLAAEMAELLRREYGGIPFDYITPVPLHPTDLRRRGFNQSELLAQSLSDLTEIPLKILLEKIFTTPPQKELSSLRREANLFGAFNVLPQWNLNDKVILLVDDVITTGSTLNECAKMLKIAGAKEVYAITVAAAI